MPDFDSMNEQDVREIVVRPLLERLGYRHGTKANVRTEVPLRYAHAFLGRKKPGKDPILAGRADYICDAVSYGRWVVESKPPNSPISRDDIEQAHTYSAHPEIAATYFMVTNGREFKLFATGQLERPIIQYNFEQMEENIIPLVNVVGYDALRKRAEALSFDGKKPLGIGLPSRLRIIGGTITYGDHTSDHPLLNHNIISKTVGTITGRSVSRSNDGLLEAVVSIISPFQQLAELNKLAGLEDYPFYCSDEYISGDVEKPTIFQNVVTLRLEPGAVGKLGPGAPEFRIPFGFDSSVFTEATGFIEDDTFFGVTRFEYRYQFFGVRRSGLPQLDAILATMPKTAELVGDGVFEIHVKADRTEPTAR